MAKTLILNHDKSENNVMINLHRCVFDINFCLIHSKVEETTCLEDHSYLRDAYLLSDTH